MKPHNVYTQFNIAHNVTEKNRILTINDLLCNPYIPEISSPSIRDVLRVTWLHKTLTQVPEA